ncbi:uncharacterized protein LOC6562528 [Drosophila grimshawi]|uniref:GH11639 n=1 Tax=Drosophila grimshawi TaxID=7222 RepID=B4JCB4_DROGR|nr:uncharacterized protein LOC6562528 [Drosophila grimshawi]EDV90281.1 GH23899 [Drosophila grimshawi]EDW04147.1 GH11639 [Drosophila grimshawi]
MDTEGNKFASTSKALGGHDEVDFTSGYETQYRKEYSPLKPMFVPPPDKRNAWYRSWSTIFVIVFLASIFLLGSILLVVQVFTVNALQVLIIVTSYVMIAALLIWLEVQSIKIL